MCDCCNKSSYVFERSVISNGYKCIIRYCLDCQFSVEIPKLLDEKIQKAKSLPKPPFIEGLMGIVRQEL